jgi:hypothetical protein
LTEACLEHLGRLPSELKLETHQVKELLAYHRIKRRTHDICSQCIEKDGYREKTCFICQNVYSDKSGITGSEGDQSGDLLDAMKADTNRDGPEWKDLTDEERAETQKKWEENLKKAGVKMLPEK